MTCYVPQTSEAKRSDTFYFLGAKLTPPEGWFHEPRSEAESALRKKKSRTRRVHSHARAMHAQHDHICTLRVHEIHAHRRCARTHMHPKRNDRSEARSRHAKITARSHLHVHVIVSKLRTHARAFKATERSEVLTSRGAKRRVRYEKEKKKETEP